MSHHLRWSAATAVLVLGVGAGAAQHLRLFAGTDSTELAAGEAEQRYDASTSPTTPGVTNTAGPTTDAAADPTDVVELFPTPGVYVYATVGGDSVDALTGAHHDYPAWTTITVTPTECGVQQRWDVLEQRWEEWQRCRDGDGVDEPARTNHDEFFGQSQTDASRCTGEPRPVTAAIGAVWTTTCTSGSTTETYRGIVVGTESRDVGGVAADTLHVTVTITDGVSSDSEVIDTWYLTGTDLVVTQSSTAATSNDSEIGIVHYTETYTMSLTALTPLT